MAGLQRSELSFRRQGSSGLVWDDKLFLSGELKKINTHQQEDNNTKSAAKSAYKAADVAPSYDPPSPKFSGCGVCGMFGKPVSSKSQKKRKPAHRTY